MNAPSQKNRYVLFQDGSMFDVLDFDTYEESVEKTFSALSEKHGNAIKIADSPFKIFQTVAGLRKDNGEFTPIGKANWKKLFLIRNDFEYYLAYVLIGGERVLVATSNKGIFWNFGIITVDL